MIFGYTASSLALRKKSLLVAMGMVAIPLSLQLHRPVIHAQAPPKTPPPPRDPRVIKLQRFLYKLDCPVATMAEDFVRVADENNLDWRLLPSIAVIESGGGKAYRNNNIFGWNKGAQSFATIRSGMELVAYKLAHSPIYRRQDCVGKLRIYNEDEDYAPSVLAVMNRISTRVQMRPVRDYIPIARPLQPAEVVRY
jgi:hypothetical protein